MQNNQLPPNLVWSEFDIPFDRDIRTGKPLHRTIATPTKEKPGDMDKKRKAKLFKDFINHPGYAEFRRIAYTLCRTPRTPASIESFIVWQFSAIARTMFDYLFNEVEQLSTNASPEDMPIVDGHRPSFFADSLNLPNDEF